MTRARDPMHRSRRPRRLAFVPEGKKIDQGGEPSKKTSQQLFEYLLRSPVDDPRCVAVRTRRNHAA